MEYPVGIFLAAATAGFARLSGFDRDRSFYPVVLVVIASYYCLFAAMGGSVMALWAETGIALLFAAAAVIGFRTSLWLVAGAIAAHGAMDFIHHLLVANPGVPPWWPGFCATIDLALGGWLALRLARHDGLAKGVAAD